MTAAPEAPTSYYSGLWADYQLGKKGDAATLDDVGWITRTRALPAGGSVLDAACGSGRVSVALARAGHSVTGVDNQDAVLDMARERAAAARVTATFLNHDVAQPFPGSYDTSLCLWGSFGFFGDEGDLEFLRNIRACTTRAFLLDAHTLESQFRTWEDSDCREAGGVLNVKQRRWDPITSKVHIDITFVQGDRVERRTHWMRVYSVREICQMLSAAGFASFDVHGDRDGNPYTAGSRRAFISAWTD